MAAQTGTVPGALARRARPFADLGLYWRAFCELSASRPSGMGVCGIPPTHVAAWCQLRQLSPDETRSVAVIVAILDAVWLEMASEDAEARR